MQRAWGAGLAIILMKEIVLQTHCTVHETKKSHCWGSTMSLLNGGSGHKRRLESFTSVLMHLPQVAPRSVWSYLSVSHGRAEFSPTPFEGFRALWRRRIVITPNLGSRIQSSDFLNRKFMVTDDCIFLGRADMYDGEDSMLFVYLRGCRTATSLR